MDEDWTIRYCEGWDPQAKALVGPISEATARGRDAAGEQYAAALFDGRQEWPAVVVEVAWRDRFARAWHIDEVGRRRRKYEYRVLADERIFLLVDTVWTYFDDEQAEFDERAGRRERTFEPDGSGRKYEQPQGVAGISSGGGVQVDPAALFRPRTEFGDIATMHWGGSGAPCPRLAEWSAAELDGPAVTPPWRPSRPLQPRYLDVMFTAGTRLSQTYSPNVTVEVVPAGQLVMPSGRLAAHDPGWLEFTDGLEPFEATIDPGSYPVELSVLRSASGHGTTIAVRLIVRDEPVVNWELALRPGQDPLLLPDGEFYGFGVDAGMGCLFDFAALSGLQKVVADAEDELVDTPTDGAFTATDPESGATLIAYLSGYGDGAYPTWIGRTAGGDIACFVSDMLVLDESTELH
ncbi:DUF4241 domain-containing protein [Kutzneria sp. NPDC052558]|uniref:DUF4241 domain-containing protein n=1 Tax=Kutzneria sp. NPDC052558 TaxID=3364121 RepID=UPI0037C67C9A